MRKFKIIAVTPDWLLGGSIESEQEILNSILAEGKVDRISLHHPLLDEHSTRRLLEGLDLKNNHKITLHDHYDLALDDYIAGGIQLNSRNRFNKNRYIEKGFSVSRSCHSIEELLEAERDQIDYSYVTLSPIFDSISKPGYRSAFDLHRLRDVLPFIEPPVVALGGVKEEHFDALKEAGFEGAALCGSFFKDYM